MIFSHDIIKNRILVFGSNGMLGQRTIKFFSKFPMIEILASSVENQSLYNSDLIDCNYVKADLTKREEVKNLILDFYPDIIINAAAFTNVDLCETERELAWKINVKGIEYISEAARIIDAHIIHISTDYIFDGTKGPYNENDAPNPLSYYGRTKLASENVLKMSGILFTIFRTNVLYGAPGNGKIDFVQWVVNKLKNNEEISIVTDQINNPTFVDDLVRAINQVIEFKKYGIYNIGGREFLSRLDFTLRIADYFNLDKTLIKSIKTEDLKQPAKRPLKSGLITIKAESQFGFKPVSIEESLAIMKTELNL